MREYLKKKEKDKEFCISYLLLCKKSSPNFVAYILWFVWIRNSRKLGWAVLALVFHLAWVRHWLELEQPGLARHFSLHLVSETLHVVSLQRLVRASSQDGGLWVDRWLTC